MIWGGSSKEMQIGVKEIDDLVPMLILLLLNKLLMRVQRGLPIYLMPCRHCKGESQAW